MSIPAALTALRISFTGRLLLPDDPAFDDARQPWNRSVPQTPIAIASPAGIDDLRLLLETARAAGFPLAVQPSGHGASSDLDGAVLVRMDAFDTLAVDGEAGTVRVGAGVRWGRVIDALDGTPWVAPSGSSPVVTVAGYTLGGGHSWFSRTAGLGSDNLRAADVLTPDGEHRRIDDQTAPELMWALRGAGGSVGVVTALEIDLVRAPAVWGSSLVFDVADAAAVIRAVRDLAGNAPESLNVFVTSTRMPDLPQLPAEERGARFVTVQALSTAGDATEALSPVREAGAVRRETSGPTSPARLIEASTEPTEPLAGRGASAAITTLDDTTIDAFVAFHADPDHDPVIGIEYRMLGGALAAPRRDGFARLDSADWLVYALAPLFPGVPVEPGDASLRAFRQIAASAATSTLPTFLAPGQSLELASTPDGIARLNAIRRRVDPDAVLHEGRLPRGGSRDARG